MKKQKIVVRQSSLTVHRYLQEDGSWGHLKTAKVFQGHDAAEVFCKRSNVGDCYGLFQASSAPPTDGPPPDWAPTADSPTWGEVRDLAQQTLEFLGGPEGAAKKLARRGFYTLACLAAIGSKREDKPIFGAKRVKLT